MANDSSNSEAIRKHLIDHYVTPARKGNDYTVTVKVGDVLKEMQSPPAIPAVCAVLGSDLFEKEARIKRLCIDGPVPGSTTLFVFKF
jgi:hypothetical protein